MNSETKRTKPGPDADTLALPGNWQDRVKDALKKKRPAGGWPKPEKGDSEPIDPDTRKPADR